LLDADPFLRAASTAFFNEAIGRIAIRPYDIMCIVGTMAIVPKTKGLFIFFLKFALMGFKKFTMAAHFSQSNFRVCEFIP
jgi:hypothetical protein